MNIASYSDFCKCNHTRCSNIVHHLIINQIMSAIDIRALSFVSVTSQYSTHSRYFRMNAAEQIKRRWQHATVHFPVRQWPTNKVHQLNCDETTNSPRTVMCSNATRSNQWNTKTNVFSSRFVIAIQSRSNCQQVYLTTITRLEFAVSGCLLFLAVPLAVVWRRDHLAEKAPDHRWYGDCPKRHWWMCVVVRYRAAFWISYDCRNRRNREKCIVRTWVQRLGYCPKDTMAPLTFYLSRRNAVLRRRDPAINSYRTTNTAAAAAASAELQLSVFRACTL